MPPQRHNVSTLFTKSQGQSPILIAKPSTDTICSAADRMDGSIVNIKMLKNAVKKAITIEIQDISVEFSKS